MIYTLDNLLWLASAPFAFLYNHSKQSAKIYYGFVQLRRRIRGEPEWQQKDWDLLRIHPPSNR